MFSHHPSDSENRKSKIGNQTSTEADRMLQRGLRGLPVPTVSADFDARVRAALRRPAPWWRPFWTAARPVLSTATCSLAVTLALLAWYTRAPVALLRGTPPTGTDAVALDRSMERLDLSTASLGGLSSLRKPPPPPVRPQPAPRKRLTPNAGAERLNAQRQARSAETPRRRRLTPTV